MKPPRHYNPEPRFGLRVSIWRWTPGVDAFEISWSVTTYNATIPRASQFLPPPLAENDLIVFANPEPT